MSNYHFLTDLVDVIIDMRSVTSNQNEIQTYNDILNFMEEKMQ